MSTTENDSTAAPVQTWALERRTGMLSRAACSACLADARTRHRCRRTSAPTRTTASRSTGATTRSDHMKIDPTELDPVERCRSERTADPYPTGPASARAVGDATPAGQARWWRRSGETVSGGRNRRMTSSVGEQPGRHRGALTRAEMPSSHGQPARVMSSTASVAGKAPRSPWAKFTTRLVPPHERETDRTERSRDRPRSRRMRTPPGGHGEPDELDGDHDG